MTAHDPPADSLDQSAALVDDPRVAAAMDEYLTAMERGARPAREAFLAQHPEIAEQLAGCLDGLELVHEATQVLKQSESSSAEWPAEEIKVPLGDFRIIREIGRGGMGIVYEAVQLSLGRRVALKVLPLAASLDPKYLQRFKNEAQAAAQLHHTNIVPVYAVGSERGVHYYAMQLIHGYSLADVIENRRRLAGKSKGDSPSAGNQPTERAILKPPSPPTSANKLIDVTQELAAPAFAPATTPLAKAETKVNKPTASTLSHQNATGHFRAAARLIQQAALALEHAHQGGVIHRDVKPANLLVDERENLWITDFGLALFQANLQLTRTGDMVGTMRYMSPEQASGDRVVLDHRTDIYSLGITLYELLTLEPAVSGADPPSALKAILDEDPIAPRLLDRRIPVELETIVLKSIAKAPADRYATAADMADDLQRWLDDKPIRARRPTLVERASRWARHHRSVVAAAAVVLCLAVIGLLITTVLIAHEHSNTKLAYEREMRERASADESFRQARRAVDTFVQLGEEELGNDAALFPLRRMFLETALEYYNNFLEQRRDDPSVQAELLSSTQWARQIVDDLSVLEQFALVMLLQNRSVQQDVALSQLQQSTISNLLKQAFPQNSAQETRREQNASPLTTEQLKTLVLEVDETLSEPQMQRLKQIDRQQRGPFAFKSPEVVAALKLTSDQRRQINAMIQENRVDRFDHGPRGGPPEPGKFGDDFGGRSGHKPGPPPPREHDDDFGGPRGRGKGFGGPGGPGGFPPKMGFKGFGFGPPDDRFGPPPPPDHADGFGGPHGKGKGGPAPGGFGGPGGRHPGEPGHGPPGEDPGRGGPFPEGFGPGGGPPGMRAAMERTVAKIVAILTPDQRTLWRDLTGKPFDHDLRWRPEF